MVRIYGHPFAAFYWKALIALYERGVPFEFLMIVDEALDLVDITTPNILHTPKRSAAWRPPASFLSWWTAIAR